MRGTTSNFLHSFPLSDARSSSHICQLDFPNFASLSSNSLFWISGFLYSAAGQRNPCLGTSSKLITGFSEALQARNATKVSKMSPRVFEGLFLLPFTLQVRKSENGGWSPCVPAEARRWSSLDFLQGNLKSCDKFGGNFAVFFFFRTNKYRPEKLGKVWEHF